MKRQYWMKINRKMAKKGFWPLVLDREDFLHVFGEDMGRSIPFLYPHINSLDVRLENMEELYDWAYNRNSSQDIMIKWYPGKVLAVGYIDGEYWCSIDGVDVYQ